MQIVSRCHRQRSCFTLCGIIQPLLHADVTSSTICRWWAVVTGRSHVLPNVELSSHCCIADVTSSTICRWWAVVTGRSHVLPYVELSSHCCIADVTSSTICRWWAIVIGLSHICPYVKVASRCYMTPEGRPGMSDVSPLSGISGLSFDSTLLSPLLFFCLVLLPFLSCRFLPAGPFF